MPDVNPQPGDEVSLKGSDGQVLKNRVFVVFELEGKYVVRLRDPSQKDGLMRVHKSRIAAILRHTVQTTPEKGKEAPVVTPVAEVKEEKPAASTKKEAAPKVAKVKKEPAKPVPFDLEKWIKEHGSIHLSKPVEFDRKEYKVSCHIAVDEKGGYYHTINTYKYPDGVISLGKNNAGGNRYPLKGHQLTFTIKTKKGEQKRTLQGELTAEKVIERSLKRGYKLDPNSKVVVKEAAAPAAKPVAAAATA